ncbi:MAG: hypothetical protein Q8Q17_01910 [bacterium]|nr:hypothetical protein [bacterium]
MQIPPLKKSTFWLIVAASVLVGIVIGGLFIGYVAFYKFKGELLAAARPPEVNTSLTPQQIQRATSLETDRTILGKVVSKESDKIVIETTVTNLLDQKNSTTTILNIPFDAQKDEVVIVKQAAVPSASSTVQEVKVSLNDIKIGQQVLIKILGGKKTIYLLPASE